MAFQSKSKRRPQRPIEPVSSTRQGLVRFGRLLVGLATLLGGIWYFLDLTGLRGSDILPPQRRIPTFIESVDQFKRSQPFLDFVSSNEGKVIRIDSLVKKEYFKDPSDKEKIPVKPTIVRLKLKRDGTGSFWFWGPCTGTPLACERVTVYLERSPSISPQFGEEHANYFIIKGYYSVDNLWGGQGDLYVTLRAVPAEQAQHA